MEQLKKPSPKVMTKEQFTTKWQSILLVNISPWPIWQSQWVKTWNELSTPKDWLSLMWTNSPSKKKPHTHLWIMIMEGGDEDMEVDVTTQQDDKLIRTETDQFMEDQNKFDFE